MTLRAAVWRALRWKLALFVTFAAFMFARYELPQITILESRGNDWTQADLSDVGGMLALPLVAALWGDWRVALAVALALLCCVLRGFAVIKCRLRVSVPPW